MKRKLDGADVVAGSGRAEPIHTGGTERLLVAIGQISVTSSTVLTPSGSAPVNDVTWNIKDASNRSPRRVWRRDTADDGWRAPTELVVTARGPGWRYAEKLCAVTSEDVARIRRQVTQARILAFRAVVGARRR